MNYQREQTWVITGGASGIGKCLVEFLVGLKQRVICIDYDQVAADHMLNVLRYRELHFIKCDLSVKEDIENAVQKLTNIYKKIDVIVHNAATSSQGIDQATYEMFLETLKVNLVAPFYLSQQLIQYLTPQASIINILSTRVFQSQKNTESYSASKGGLHALTHAMAISLKGIARVNAISPGWIDTTSCEKKQQSHTLKDHMQHPSQRIGAPMDVIRAILFLSDPQNDFINGTNLTLDGGMSKQMIYHNDFGWHFEPLEGVVKP